MGHDVAAMILRARFRRAARRAAAIVGVVLALAGPVEAATRRIDVGGRHVRLSCRGTGLPLVVLESGLGDPLEVWNWVLPELSEWTRVCAYDRAGVGRSDPGPAPRDAGRLADELLELLDRAGERGPLVLVGHSFGGMIVQVAAARAPHRVAGLVLLDATHEDYPQIEARRRSPAARRKWSNAVRLAGAGVRGEYEAMPASAAIVRDLAPLPEVPLVVVAAGRSKADPALQSIWLDLQRKLARRTPSGHLVVAEGSGHYIQHERPDLVVEVVTRVLAASWRGPLHRSLFFGPD